MPTCRANWLRPLAFVLAAFTGMACGERAPREEIPIGGGYAQCEKHSAGGTDQSTEISLTRNTLLPGGTPNCTGKRSFSVAGREVFFTYIAYGELQDCPAGCFSSSFCAVVDGNSALLFSTTGSEPPFALDPSCYGANGAIDNRCLPGAQHPLVNEPVFQSFRDVEKSGGSFRFCFSGNVYH